LSFSNGTKQNDDLTAVVIKRTGAAKAAKPEKVLVA